MAAGTLLACCSAWLPALHGTRGRRAPHLLPPLGRPLHGPRRPDSPLAPTPAVPPEESSSGLGAGGWEPGDRFPVRPRTGAGCPGCGQEREPDPGSRRALSCSVLVARSEDTGSRPRNRALPRMGATEATPLQLRGEGAVLMAAWPWASVGRRCNSWGAAVNNPSQNREDAGISRRN